MSSVALTKFNTMLLGGKILQSQAGSPSTATTDQVLIDQTFYKAAVALGVGCWEGYIEAALREFVAKVRLQAHRRNWTMISIFEAMVDAKASNLNTPNWEQSRALLIEVTGMDPYASWSWAPKFTNQNDTKQYFDGIMKVRHAFAHGFAVPNDVPGVTAPGILDDNYVTDALSCLEFFAITTEGLLEYELLHRHTCVSGWN